MCKYLAPNLEKQNTPNAIARGGQTMEDIKVEITKQIAFLSESLKGSTKELNPISWNGREPKYDIRDWAPNHEKMGKGVTLSQEEVDKLKEVLSALE